MRGPAPGGLSLWEKEEHRAEEKVNGKETGRLSRKGKTVGKEENGET